MNVADFVDMSTEEIGKLYLDKQDDAKEAKLFMDTAKDCLMDRAIKFGSPEGEHLSVVDGSVKVTRQKRVSWDVCQAPAVALFEERGWQGDMTVSSSISLKKNVSPDEVPTKLLIEMEKYFDVSVEKTVDKDSLTDKHVAGELTDEEFESLSSEKVTYALLVKKV